MKIYIKKISLKEDDRSQNICCLMSFLSLFKQTYEILRITKLPSKSNAIFLVQFILEGDEILEWNEQSLVDCTEKEVNEIMTVDDSMDIHIRLSRTW